jgi:hypothetical protein
LKSIVPRLIVKKKNALQVIAYIENDGLIPISLDHSGHSFKVVDRGKQGLKGNRGNSELHKYYSHGYNKREAIEMMRSGIEPVSKADNSSKGFYGDREKHAEVARLRHK